MTSDIELFLTKLEMLRVHFDEIHYEDFYNDLFPVGAFETKGQFDENKGNGIAVEICNDKSKNHLITEDREIIHDLVNLDFVVTSPISYFGRRRSAKNSTLLYGLTFDLDGVSMKSLGNLLHQFEHKANPTPTYIVNSGHGLHLYYIFKEPIKLYNHIKEPLKKLKFELINKLWNTNTSELKDRQYQGIFQGFRMVGSPTKFGKKHRLVSFKSGVKVDLNYLNHWVSDEAKVTETNYRSTLSLEQAKKKYPDWYERKIVQGIYKPKKWNIKRDLYDWWKQKIIVEASYGHRYFCLMVLAIYAKKCNITYEELERDAYKLMPILNDKANEPFTEVDVKSALKSYNDNYTTFPRKDIEKLTAVSIPANKRNYRKQKEHVKMMNLIRDNISYPNGEWRNTSGAPTKEELVRNWRNENPTGTKAQCNRDTGIDPKTIRKWWS